MPPTDNPVSPVDATGDERGMDRLTNLLALIAVKGLPQAEQILLLDAAGFAAKHIATLLRTTPNTVSVTLYQERKAAKKKKPAARSR